MKGLGLGLEHSICYELRPLRTKLPRALKKLRVVNSFFIFDDTVHKWHHLMSSLVKK